MAKDLFDVIRFDLPIAIEGYYAPKGVSITDVEIRKIRQILSPYIQKSVFDRDLDIVKLFSILFISIRVKKRHSSKSYKLEIVQRMNEIQADKIQLMASILENRKSNIFKILDDSIDEVKFTFKNGKTIKMTGSMTDFLFEFVFAMLCKMDSSKIENIKDMPLELSGFLYFKSKYEEIISRGKRQYNRGGSLTKKEYDLFVIKEICKGLHNFLVKYSILVQNGKKTSREELRLIQSFIEASDYEEYIELPNIRNFIIRG